MPVGGVHVFPAHRDHQQDQAGLEDHHGHVHCRRLADADIAQPGQQQHDAGRRQVGDRPGGLQFAVQRRADECGRQMDVEMLEQAQEVAGPADRHCRGGHAVFQHQHPADEPRGQLAEGGVGVGVGAAGDRHHRSEFGVGHRTERTAHRCEHEREHDRRAGMVGRRLAGDDEDAAADHRPNPQGGQPPGAKRALQAQPIGRLMAGVRVFGGPKLFEHEAVPAWRYARSLNKKTGVARRS